MAAYQQSTNGHIVAIVRIKGYKPVRKSHRTKTLAKIWAQGIEDQMRSGVYQKQVVVAKDDSLSVVFDKYAQVIVPRKKSPRFHLMNIKTLSQHLGAISFRELTANDIIKFVNARLDGDEKKGIKPVKTSTTKKEINTLSAVYRNALALWGYELAVNPVAQAKAILKENKSLLLPKPRARRLADGEEDRLVEALKDAPEPLAIVLLTLQTARRLQELIAIKPGLIQVRDGRTFLLVKDNKTSDNLSVPLTPKAAELIGEIGEFTVRTDSVSQAVYRAAKRAGLDNLTLNDLRHEALSRLFERGFNVGEVMAVSGHRSAETLLKIYTQVQGDKVSEKLLAL